MEVDLFFERITAESDASVRIEHELRYRWAEPAINGSKSWIDLGCGAGIGAMVVATDVLERIVLVDADEQALAQANDAFGRRVPDCRTLCLDLADAGALERFAQAVATDDGAVVTCFEVVEHLDDHQHLIELLGRLVREQRFTCLLSVPNDAFFGIDNPYHMAKWGAAEFDELLQFLPSPRTVAHQSAFVGSFIDPVGGGDGSAPSAEAPIERPVDGAAAVPSHLLVAFGPLAEKLGPVGAGAVVDYGAKRAWERQREADREYFRVRLAQREEEIKHLKYRISELEAGRLPAGR